MPSAAGTLSAMDLFGIFANAISIVVGILAIWLSWEFYKQTNSTEKQVSNSLAKIEAQTTSLQKLSAKWMDRLTSYVTTDRPIPADTAMPQLVEAFAQLPSALLAQLTSIHQDQGPKSGAVAEGLIEELVNSYIALYYYTAIANYWARFYLPEKTDFRPDDSFHVMTMRIVDMSHADFQHMARILGTSDQHRLDKARLAHLLTEAKDIWRDRVRTTAELYAAREQPTKNPS